ncbi:uncharacterized protein LOC135847291 [Planococcus citri]|uniref:uncharacterized protein LOC135847291 n=1 Tax=Planococcus citri TaxID=170843 RepID=UPI0031F749D6
MKSFLLLTLLLGVISASTGYSRNVAIKDVSDAGESEDELDEDEDVYKEEDEEEKDDEEEETIHPSLICTLLTTQGCDAGCQIVGNIYGTPSTGHCDDETACLCEPSENTSLVALWNRKFDNRFVLPGIKVDAKLSEKVKELLKTSTKSSEETKEELKSILPKQYQKIRIKAKAIPTTIPQADGKFNKELAKKYTDLKLQPFMNGKFSKNIDYKKSLTEALEKAPDEDTFQHLVHDVRSTRNSVLGKIVDEYLKSKKKTESSVEKEDDLTDFVNSHIINKYITAISAKRSEMPKSKSTTPAPRPVTPNKKPSDSNQGPIKSSTKSRADYSLADLDTTLNPKDYPPLSRAPYPSKIPDFTTPDATINKNLIDSLKEPFDKIWSGPGYYIRYNRQSPSGPTLFSWRKNQDEVHIKIFEGGAIDQIWHFYTPFGYKVPIWLFQDTDGSRKQIWKFARAYFEYDDEKDSQPHGVWNNNFVDAHAYTMYGKFIKSWCDANDFFVGKERCVIF